MVQHRPILEELIARTHRAAFGIFVATFAGYGVALWIWFSGNSWTALIVATLSYLFFRQFRTLAFALARVPLRGRAAAIPVLKRIEQALDKGTAATVIAELEGHLRAMGQESRPG